MKPVIILLTFGTNEGLFAESLLAISTWIRFRRNSNFLICVYTDNPEFYNTQLLKDELIIVNLESKQIDEWRKPDGFIFRAKIKCLSEASKKFNSPLLYIDADTVLLKDPSDLLSQFKNQRLLMHTNEGLLEDKGNPIMRKMYGFLKKQKPKFTGLSQRPEQLAMWNAGVLGFGPQHYNLLDLVLEVTDDLYAKYPKHVVEQFAFSWVFQEKGEIFSADSHIWHYWFYKAFREELLPHVNSMRQAKTPQDLWKLAEPLQSKLLQKTGPDPKAPFLSRLWKRFKILLRGQIFFG